ncbi:MAG: stage 0 sporulation protein [Ruminococcaceae bacterium]|nr:stage 0 sporulation protein [Oscillospiraceae bacterium]
MAEIIGVKFRSGGKIYYFSPNDQPLAEGTKVIVETARGLECGEVAMGRKEIPDEQITHQLKQVVREATDADLKRVEDNKKKEESAFGICEKRIAAHNLPMKLVGAECAFDNSKILFSFTSDGRVDFRELVKDLAGIFRTRIELRQIGVRDEAKMLGGLGICGRPFCCSTFIGDFQPVSIKMAKEQGLSLNPVKISGTCGRLMCCLKYEQEAYEDLIKTTPRVGSIVNTPDGKGTIIDVNLISGILKVSLDAFADAAPRSYSKKLVKVIGKGARPVEEPVEEEELPPELLEEEKPKQEKAPEHRQNHGGQNRQNHQNRGQNQNRTENISAQTNNNGSHQNGGNNQRRRNNNNNNRGGGQRAANYRGGNRGSGNPRPGGGRNE